MQMPQGLNAHLPIEALFYIFAKKFRNCKLGSSKNIILLWCPMARSRYAHWMETPTAVSKTITSALIGLINNVIIVSNEICICVLLIVLCI
jgi:hypothetical protein